MLDIVTLGLDYCHQSDFMYCDDSHDWWLLVHTKTCAVFFNSLNNGEIISAPPNSVVLFPPHFFAHYGAANSDYINSFIRFYTDESFITNAKIPMGLPFLVRDPETLTLLFRIISTEHFLGSDTSAQSITLLMRLIMLKLSESVNKVEVQELERELNNLRYEIQMKPNYPWTVADMAKNLHISAGYLQSIYKKQFGVSCMHDVLQKRIELAKDYLLTSQYSIQRIAPLCGYQSSEHFCRQFKSVTGLSPTAFRAQHEVKE